VTDVDAEVGSAQAAFDAAGTARLKAQADDDAAAARLAKATAAVGTLGATQHVLAQQLQAARDRLRDVAIASYVSGGAGIPLVTLLSATSIGDFGRRQELLSAIADDASADVRQYNDARAAAAKATVQIVDSEQQLEAAKAATDANLLLANSQLDVATAALGERQQLLSLTGDALVARGTDIPRMILDAYQRAASALQAKGCQIGWWVLAGIGKVESDHGRAHDAKLAPNGDLVPRILGPALDGSNGTAAIPATDGGKYTGDPVWDHAVGPMQFIPSTWVRWQRDGNGDGVANPNNIYDASLAAASYLCAVSTNLYTDAGLEAAYDAYNHSADYVAEVLAFDHVYQLADSAGDVPAMSPTPLYQEA
jgi:membrane-bound lytic murein transglycosylase B